MPRVTRTDIGGEAYHILNRANARVQIFDNEKDYRIFEDILAEAVKKFDMRLLAYCVMPNHWHLVLHPKQDGDLQKFMGWLTNTHTRRWHTSKKTIGEGHLYQGRYKSFLCQTDEYLFSLIRYVERNAKKANLCNLAEDWEWSSVYKREKREKGTDEQKSMLAEWPIEVPKNYLSLLNTKQNASEEDAIEKSIIKNSPYGDDGWIKKIAQDYGLQQTLRRVGRPRNGG